MEEMRFCKVGIRMRQIFASVLGGVGICFSLAGFAAGSESAPASPQEAAIDPATVSQWAAPFRNWHYWPEHVIPASPEIPGFTNILGTDVPTVFQIPGDAKWHMSFVGFDGRVIGRS